MIPNPMNKTFATIFSEGHVFGTLETCVVLSFLWSIFGKWPVINVTLHTLKLVVHKYMTNMIFPTDK